MKRSLAFTLVSALLFALLCGCGAADTAQTAAPSPTLTPSAASASPAPEPTSSPLPSAPPETPEPTDTPVPAETEATTGEDASLEYYDAYKPILDSYFDMLSKPIDGETLINSQLCFLCLYCLDPLNDVGYAFYDMDADGSMELIIGNFSQEEYLENVIFDMYYLDEGQPSPVFQSQERERFYITYVGHVLSDWANSASDNGLTAYGYQSGKLTQFSYVPTPFTYKEFDLMPFASYAG